MSCLKQNIFEYAFLGDVVYSVDDILGGNKNKGGIFITFLLQRFIVKANQYF